MRLIRHGQITLPAEARKTPQLQDGDYLEARGSTASSGLGRSTTSLGVQPIGCLWRPPANQVPTREGKGPCHLTYRLYEMTPYLLIPGQVGQ